MIGNLVVTIRRKKDLLLSILVIFIIFISIGSLRASDSSDGAPYSLKKEIVNLLESLVPVVYARIGKQDYSYPDWVLPDIAPSPLNNRMDDKKAELGKMLFFDPRVSGRGDMSCATCHDPRLGWSDGLATAHGDNSKVLSRATPSIINVGFNTILMWDGRAQTLEDQAMGPVTNPDEMHNTVKNLVLTLKGIPGYAKGFKEAFWGLKITPMVIRRSIAMFQRKIVANNSPFDKWVRGDGSAMNDQQISGFEVFKSEKKGNCTVCHRPPNFTDNGFHNIGLASFEDHSPDLGRYFQKRVNMTKGAFKTPQLRNIAKNAPYFHDGSAATLMDVVEHYAVGGLAKSNLSPNMSIGKLSKQDKLDLVEFLKALTSELDPKLTQYTLPE